ncbi:acyltransferase family protein [Azospira restricta]|uniref:Acyltransferase n=1 Tax=Azospira restricta TaxID=404405 RepID=A0A974SNE9_9RHOO|nr:acyltransferase [Azospira restricta]QRJ63502.1 acyltransferase [Azospira restricta]
MNVPSNSLFILALRALAALIIVAHHFALYAPLRDWAAPLAGDVLDFLARHARATQVFFVVGGFVAARTIGNRLWSFRQLGRFAVQRYCRLGLPYLAVVAIVIPIYAFARGWVPDDVLGSPVNLLQLLAHVFFLQDILGYEPLSAGLWFVCINFQLSLAYALILAGERRFGRGDGRWFLRLGWCAAAFSLFHFNLNPEWEAWGLYFFPYFFMGVLVHHAVQHGERRHFLAYQALLLLAICFEWRWRVVVAMVFATMLFVVEYAGLGQRWPRSRWLAALGRISFSLFLVHFPVLVLVGAVCARMGWSSPQAALAALVAAFALSLAAAAVFHRWVEAPATRLSRRFRPSLAPARPAGAERSTRLAFEN